MISNTIKNMKIFMLASIFLGIVCITHAEGSDNQNPQEIVKSSFKVMSQASFRAETYQNGIKAVIYHRANPDGTVDIRTEYSMGQPVSGQIDTNWTSVLLINRDGVWKLMPDIALRLDYQKKAANAAKASGPMDRIKQDEYDYSISEGVKNGIPCYLIKATIQDAARSRAIASLENNSALKNMVSVSQLLDKFPVEVRYCIGKTSLFMYSNEGFSKDGKKFMGLEYTNVDLGIVLADDLFRVPKYLKERILNSSEEAKEFTMVAGIDAPHFKKIAKNPVSKKIISAALIFCVLMSLPVILFLMRSKLNARPGNPPNT